MKKLLLMLSGFTLLSAPVATTVISCGNKVDKTTVDRIIDFDNDNGEILRGNSKEFKVSEHSYSELSNAKVQLTSSSSNSNVAKVDESFFTSDNLPSSITVQALAVGTTTITVQATNLSTQQIYQGTITVSVFAFDDVSVKSSVSDGYDFQDEFVKSTTPTLNLGTIVNYDEVKEKGYEGGFSATITTKSPDSKKTIKDDNTSSDDISKFFVLTIDSNGGINASLSTSAYGDLDEGEAVVTVSNTSAKISSLTFSFSYKKYTAATALKADEIKSVGYDYDDNNNATESDQWYDNDSYTKKYQIATLYNKFSSYSDESMLNKLSASKPSLDTSNVKYLIESTSGDDNLPFDLDKSTIEIDNDCNVLLTLDKDNQYKSFASGQLKITLIVQKESDPSKFYSSIFTISYAPYRFNTMGSTKLGDSSNELDCTYKDSKFDAWETKYAEQDDISVTKNTSSSILQKLKNGGYAVKDVVVACEGGSSSYTGNDDEVSPKYWDELSALTLDKNGYSTSSDTIKNLDSSTQIEAVNSTLGVNIKNVSVSDSGDIKISFGGSSTKYSGGVIHFIVRFNDSLGNIAVATAEFDFADNNIELDSSFAFDSSVKNNGSQALQSIMLKSVDQQKIKIGTITVKNVDVKDITLTSNVSSSEPLSFEFVAQNSPSSNKYDDEDNPQAVFGVYVTAKGQSKTKKDGSVKLSVKSSLNNKVDIGDVSIYYGAYVASTNGGSFTSSDLTNKNSNIYVSKNANNPQIQLSSSINTLEFESGCSYNGNSSPVYVYKQDDSSSSITVQNIIFDGNLTVTGAYVVHVNALSTNDVKIGSINFNGTVTFNEICPDSEKELGVIAGENYGFDVNATFKESVNITSSGKTIAKNISLFAGQTTGGSLNITAKNDINITNSWTSGYTELISHRTSDYPELTIGDVEIDGNLTIKSSSSLSPSIMNIYSSSDLTVNADAKRTITVDGTTNISSTTSAKAYVADSLDCKNGVSSNSTPYFTYNFKTDIVLNGSSLKSFITSQTNKGVNFDGSEFILFNINGYFPDMVVNLNNYNIIKQDDGDWDHTGEFKDYVVKKDGSSPYLSII